MSASTKWKSIGEAVGTLAIVISLVYVGIQVRQNTQATQAETSQSLYSQLIGRIGPLLESPELADLIVRARRRETLSAGDSLRYLSYLNLQLNEYEAALANLRQGTLEPDMARSWLFSMAGWSCRPGARELWRSGSTSWIAPLRTAMDSVIADTECGSN